VLLILLLSPSAGAAPPLQYENGRINARLHHADVTEALREVAQLAQVEIRGRPAGAARPVDLELRGVSLHEALAQLLGRQSFVIFYSGERPVRVVLVGGGPASSVLASAPPPEKPENGSNAAPRSGDKSASTPQDTAPSDPEDDTGPAADSNRPVTIHGALAQSLGADSMSFSDVTAVAVRDPDPAVRAEALRVGLGILEDESELSASFLEVLEQRDDAALADWLTRVAGDNALEIARGMERETGIEALRLRARAIAKQLEAVE
jgi:hypothetical protein